MVKQRKKEKQLCHGTLEKWSIITDTDAEINPALVFHSINVDHIGRSSINGLRCRFYMPMSWKSSIIVNQNLPDTTSWSPPVLIYLPRARRSAAINSTISTFCATASLSFSPSVTHTYARHSACEIKAVDAASAVRPHCAWVQLAAR